MSRAVKETRSDLIVQDESFDPLNVTHNLPGIVTEI